MTTGMVERIPMPGILTHMKETASDLDRYQVSVTRISGVTLRIHLARDDHSRDGPCEIRDASHDHWSDGAHHQVRPHDTSEGFRLISW